MSEQMIVPIIVASFTLMGLIFSGLIQGYVAFSIAKLNSDQRIRSEAEVMRQHESAERVAAVKTSLEASARVAEKKFEETAAKVEEVKASLVTATDSSNRQLSEQGMQLTELHIIATATHGLLNSVMSEKLDRILILTERIAELTGDPTDIQAMEVAKEEFDDHQTRQARADSWLNNFGPPE